MGATARYTYYIYKGAAIELGCAYYSFNFYDFIVFPSWFVRIGRVFHLDLLFNI